MAKYWASSDYDASPLLWVIMHGIADLVATKLHAAQMDIAMAHTVSLARAAVEKLERDFN
ncbi:hypothetical protein [Erythrobacter ani]|uniref:Uncharacterized protein n=1 Tax=Erythrobacter ani TaxID=2827235 RepID=A0ABS6SMQ6_9SPHN|nr:hypothetical protein [Erythrobacter ani]MBV7266121.1 hypothetical protein [Erythrobacter ani]